MSSTLKYFRVVQDSFIGNKLILAESREVVQVETDLTKGGMTPGSNLVRVNDDGSDLTEDQLAEENKAETRAKQVLAAAATEEAARKTAALRESIRQELLAEMTAANKGATSAQTGGTRGAAQPGADASKGTDFA